MKSMSIFNRKKKAFSLPELSVVMFLTTLITGVLVVFYAQSRLTLQRGVQKTGLQQQVRMGAIRVVPKITSTFSIPPNEATGTARLRPVEWPHPTDFPAGSANSDRPNYIDAQSGGEYFPENDIGEPKIMLISTQEFVKSQLRMPLVADDIFNPRDPRYGKLELSFQNMRAHPKAKEAGELKDIGDLVMRGHLNLDNDPDFETVTDDVMVVSGLTNVSFLLYPDSRRVRLRVEAQDYIPNATSNGSGERTVETEVYNTDIFLPVYTSAGG